MLKIIDPHIHLFNLEQGEYAWLKKGQPPFWPDKSKIAKDFVVRDLSEAFVLDIDTNFDLCGVVHIEAGFDNINPLREIAWLETEFSSNTMNAACIAFADITESTETFEKNILKLTTKKMIRGVRYIIEDFDALCAHQQLADNIQILANHGFVFELQIADLDLPKAQRITELFSLRPDLKVALNHAGFLHNLIKTNTSSALSIYDCLAQLPNMCVKASGFEMLDRQYQMRDTRRMYDALLASFGSERVMAASNFPLTLFSKTYYQYWQDTLICLDEMGVNDNDRTSIVYDTARSFYRID